MTDFDPGPVAEPFATLVREAPGDDVYAPGHFRVEWGPIFHRGRLDGTARVLVIGQDPGQHESIARRILVGEAGQRVQGFLAKLGIAREYVMVNAFLYSVYGSARPSTPIADERGRWLSALFDTSPIQAVVAFGDQAANTFDHWRQGPGAAHAGVAFEHVHHPTWPNNADDPAAATTQMLAEWTAALQRLAPVLGAGQPSPYGAALLPADRSPIPDFDLPAGSPPWFRSLKQWASREAFGVRADADQAAKDEAKRATVVVVVPRAERPWHVP